MDAISGIEFPSETDNDSVTRQLIITDEEEQKQKDHEAAVQRRLEAIARKRLDRRKEEESTALDGLHRRLLEDFGEDYLKIFKAPDPSTWTEKKKIDEEAIQKKMEAICLMDKDESNIPAIESDDEEGDPYGILSESSPLNETSSYSGKDWESLSPTFITDVTDPSRTTNFDFMSEFSAGNNTLSHSAPFGLSGVPSSDAVMESDSPDYGFSNLEI